MHEIKAERSHPGALYATFLFLSVHNDTSDNMGNGKEAVAAKDIMPKEGKKAQEEAMKKMEALLDRLDDKYGAIIPSGSGRDGRLALSDFRSHQSVSLHLSNIPSQIEANKVISDIKEELGALMLKFDPNSKGIEYFTDGGKSTYNPKTRELEFSLVLRIDEVALKQAWQSSRLALQKERTQSGKLE